MKNLVFAVAKRTLRAMSPYLGHVLDIWDGILSNPINAGTLEFVWNNKLDLASFFIDLMEPLKRFKDANSDGEDPAEDPVDHPTDHPTDHPADHPVNHPADQPVENLANHHNELDLNLEMNRHAVVCQLQRLAKSLLVVLSDGTQNKGLDKFEMKTELESDSSVANQDIKLTWNREETWFFVNGIAGEVYWQKLALKKLVEKFSNGIRAHTTAGTSGQSATLGGSGGQKGPEGGGQSTEIRGIFNRSDGILWDLIECAGERYFGTVVVRDGVIQRTKSSQIAQEELKLQLKAALNKNQMEGQAKGGRHLVVVVAHSQGCLLLRLVLEELGTDSKFDEQMRTRLRVFTFGNPSFDWDVHDLVNHTEHFANKKDFVAKLGVLRDYHCPLCWSEKVNHPYHCRACSVSKSKHRQQFIFVNETRTGHLFGAQYSLEQGDYICINRSGKRSMLLDCANGVPMVSE